MSMKKFMPRGSREEMREEREREKSHEEVEKESHGWKCSPRLVLRSDAQTFLSLVDIQDRISR